jgi:hypothetical protein
MNTTPARTRTRRLAAITPIMTRLAAGDVAALEDLVREFGPTLRLLMRNHLADMGWRSPPPEALEDLVMDAALELHRRAGGWRPDGGAMPWQWAAPRLRSIAARYLGQHSDDLDDHVAEPCAHEPLPVDNRTVLEVLDDLARLDPRVQSLRERLLTAATDRDAAVWLEVRQEAAAGNARPAVTVDAAYGMQPAAVRKVVQRVNARLAGALPETAA